MRSVQRKEGAPGSCPLTPGWLSYEAGAHRVGCRHRRCCSWISLQNFFTLLTRLGDCLHMSEDRTGLQGNHGLLLLSLGRDHRVKCTEMLPCFRFLQVLYFFIWIILSCILSSSTEITFCGLNFSLRMFGSKNFKSRGKESWRLGSTVCD